jgi:hypothetical protein
VVRPKVSDVRSCWFFCAFYLMKIRVFHKNFKLLLNCRKKNQPDWIRFQTISDSRPQRFHCHLRSLYENFNFWSKLALIFIFIFHLRWSDFISFQNMVKQKSLKKNSILKYYQFSLLYPTTFWRTKKCCSIFPIFQ